MSDVSEIPVKPVKYNNLGQKLVSREELKIAIHSANDLRTCNLNNYYSLYTTSMALIIDTYTFGRSTVRYEIEGQMFDRVTGNFVNDELCRIILVL